MIFAIASIQSNIETKKSFPLWLGRLQSWNSFVGIILQVAPHLISGEGIVGVVFVVGRRVALGYEFLTTTLPELELKGMIFRIFGRN